MARPRIDSLQPGFSLSENIWGTSSWGTINNPNLEPLESKNIDVSWEWYFAEGGLLAATLFYKDMKNFEESESISVYWQDFRGATDLTGVTALSALMEIPDESRCLPDRYSIWHDIGVRSGCDLVTVRANRNGAGATTQGVELSYNQNYDFLPGIWSGLGIALNYTYSDSETEAEQGTLTTELAAMPLARVPRHTANATLFWERDGHLIRLSYNYRTDSLENRSFFNGALWNEGGDRLDLSATWKINDNFSMTLSGVNLTDEISRQYYTSLTDPGIEAEGNALDGDVTTSRTIKEWQTGRLFRLGVRASF
ncbi:TonB-dependent receptor [Exilibacterium tricleocarpae]|uniref:TonB-dependent receptor n=2 Tax=Exilibacterium tricleocarpae TaxID=2591008 RepID=A0A545TNN9_9GAMM|nr:TonB-dependent receptor [Exilibacterium tricleocarpae]